MEGRNPPSEASVHMKAPRVGARESAGRSPFGKTPARLSSGDIMLRIAFGWTLFFCAVSLASGSDQPDVSSTAGGKHFSGRALAEVPEDLSLGKFTLNSQQTSSPCEDTKCLEETSHAEVKLLTPKTDAGASQAWHTDSSFSFESPDGGEDSVLSSGDVSGTHLLRISQSDTENAHTFVQPRPEVSDVVLPTALDTPLQPASGGAISHAVPDTRLKGLPAAPPTYDEVLRELRLEGKFPPHTAQIDLPDEVGVPLGRDRFDVMNDDTSPSYMPTRDPSDKSSVPVGGDGFRMMIEDRLPPHRLQNALFDEISISDDAVSELAFSELPTARERHLSRSVNKAFLMCLGIITLIVLLVVGLSAVGL